MFKVCASNNASAERLWHVHVHLQDFVDLGDDVLRARALSLQGHAVPHALSVQAAELGFG